MRSAIALLLAVFLTSLAFAQDSTDSRDKTFGILPVPAFGYTPETRGYVGAVALVTTDFYKNDSTRISNGKLEINYTQNRQWIFTAAYEHYFPNDDYILTTSLSYLLFPELFYGIGNNTEEEDEELYESRRIEWFAGLEQRIFSRMYVGVFVQGQRMWDVAFPENTGFSSEGITGFDGGISSGGGYALRWDNRDGVLNATEGWLAQWQHTVFDDLTGSEFEFQRMRLDIRKFQRITKSSVLAFQGLAQFHTNEPPMRMLALLGGDQIMRGYYIGQYRDRQLGAVQAEWRQQLFWRVGVVGFAGVGKVGRRVGNLTPTNLKPSYGGGLRFRVDDEDNINMRFDFAAGSDGSTGFYVAFGEAF